MSITQSLKGLSQQLINLESNKAVQDTWHSPALTYAKEAVDNVIARQPDSFDGNTVASIQKSLTVFQHVIQSLDTANLDKLENCSISSFNFVNGIPFVKDNPQLVCVSPSFILRKSDNPLIHFKLLGNFPEKASIKLSFPNEQTITLRTPYRLDFKILQDTIFPIQDNPAQLSLKRGSLEVISSSITNLFQFTIGGIPSSPGTITISYSYTTQRSMTDTYDYTSNSIMVSSTKEFGNNNDQDTTSAVYPNSGRSFVPGTGIAKIEESHGKGATKNDENDYDGPHLVESVATHIKFRTITRYHRVGTSGHRVFRILAKETHTYSVTDTHLGAQVLTLDWGASQTWTYPSSLSGTPTITFTPFQGAVHSYTSSFEARYVKIIYGAGSVTFTTPNPLG